MGVVPEQMADIFMLLAGILHLGNVTFVSAAGAQIAEKSGIYTIHVMYMYVVFLLIIQYT